MPLTPEQQKAIDEAMGILSSAGRFGPGAGQPAQGRPRAPVPQVPAQRQPDLRTAERDLQRAASEAYQLKSPGPEGQAEAVRLVQQVRAKPDDIPAQPTLAQQAERALLPKQLTGEGRPQSAADIARSLAYMAGSINPQSPVGKAVKIAAGQDPNRIITEDEKGIAQENAVLYAMRTLGSAVPAVIVESAGRVPVPDVTRESFLQAFTEPTTIGEAITGAPITSNQRIRRDDPVSDWAQGILERIEEGRGTEGDFESGFRERFGEEWANTGWWLGLFVDALTGWEDMAAKAASKPVKVAATAARLGELAPQMTAAQRLVTAVRGNEVSAGEYVGGKLVASLEGKGGSIDDLPAAIRLRAEEVARAEHDMSLVELSKLEGVGAPRTQLADDPEYIKQVAEIEEARKAYGAVAGPVDKQGVPQALGMEPPATKKKAATLKEKREKIRPNLPDFGHKINHAAQYWEGAKRLSEAPDRHPLGYDTPRGDAFKRYQDADKMTIDQPAYVIRTEKGDVVGDPMPFDEAVIKLARRKAKGIEGDGIWWGSQRPVARWGKSKAGGGEKLSVSWHFGSPDEELFVRRLAEAGDPAVFPGRARQIATEKAATNERIAGSILADALTRAPAKSVTAKSGLGRVVQEATRLAFRDIMGEDRLEQLATGAFVAKGERAAINKRAAESLGLSPARAEEVMRGSPLTAAEAQKVSDAARSLGVPMKGPATSIDPVAWRQLWRRSLEREAGVLADTRYRVRGTAPFLQRAFRALSDAHLDRRAWSATQKMLMDRGPVRWVSELFLDDKLSARIPSEVRSKLKELHSRLERSSDDVRDDFQHLKGGTVAERITSLMRRYAPLHPEQLDIADEMRRVDLAKPGGTVDAESIVRKIEAAWRGPRPHWMETPNENVRLYGALRWATDAEAEAADLGRRWVEAQLTAARKEVKGTDLAPLLQRKISTDTAAEVYREVYRDGILDGPALQRALGEADMPALKLDSDRAMVLHVLAQRHEAIVDEVMGELVGSGVVVRGSDVRRSALAAVLKGTHKTWNKALSRWEYRYPEAQVTWALGRLRDWGVDVGSEAATVTRTIGRQLVTMPRYLSDELHDMVSSGALDSRALYGKSTAGQALNELTRAFKEWTMAGVILPNPTYFTGQALGMWPVLWTTRGPAGTARVAGNLIRHPLITGELLRRLGGEGMPIFTPRPAEGFLLRTDAGEIYTLDELESLMRRYGVHETQTSFETAKSFESVIAAERMTMDPLKIRLGIKRWQQVIRKSGGAFDMAGRVGVFLDALKRGASPDVAARVARESLLDFRNMTEFEQRYMRMVFTFYAFMRKNSDAYIRALFENPSRVMSQMRLAEASITYGGLSDIELGAISNQDIARLTILDDDEVFNDAGRPHPLYRLNRLQSPPLGVGEWLGTMRALVSPLLGGEEDRRQLLGMVNPLGQTAAIWFLNRKLDREFADSARANRIPPVLMDSFMGPLFREAFSVGPMALSDTDDPLTADPDATDELGSGHPAVWAAGNERGLSVADAQQKRKLWQSFMTWFGRPISTLGQIAEGTGPALDYVPVLPGEPPPPQLTQGEVTLSLLTGLRWRSAIDEREAKRRALRQREAAYQAQQEEVQLPNSRVKR